MNCQPKPFLMHFAETIENKRIEYPTYYDTERDITFFINPDGRKEPLVRLNKLSVGTRTMTEVQREPSDSDLHNEVIKNVGTMTKTSIQKESHDTDIDNNLRYFGTQTVTKAGGEPTDSDD